ncbi:MAG: DUF5602 domain-containing protein [Gemmatimonadota bacterium]|nr:DUF5602 domain-containing protein [Gemmatimonadota bacterium]
MKKMILSSTAAVVIAVAGTALACGGTTEPNSLAALTYGASQSFAQGTARAWVQTDDNGAPSSMGIALTEGALTGLPTTVSGPSPTALMVSLALPAAAAGTGFDHAEIGWNPNGHDPVAIYGSPHFDMHFYMISAATQAAILPNDPQWGAKAANLPTSAFVPVGYVPPPAPIAASAVPQMGVHWTDVKSPEFNGQPFTSTFIYGSWDGKYIFLEPMITKAYLESHPNAVRAIPQPAQWTAPGAYPTTWTVAYDATAKEFRITLGGLTKH